MQDIIIDLLGSFAIERREADQQLEDDAAQRPPVHHRTWSKSTNQSIMNDDDDLWIFWKWEWR